MTIEIFIRFTEFKECLCLGRIRSKKNNSKLLSAHGNNKWNEIATFSIIFWKLHADLFKQTNFDPKNGLHIDHTHHHHRHIWLPLHSRRWNKKCCCLIEKDRNTICYIKQRVGNPEKENKFILFFHFVLMEKLKWAFFWMYVMYAG